MKAMLIAAAIVAGSAIAAPVYAQNAAPATQEVQPAPTPAPEQAGGGEEGGGEQWEHGRGQWGMRGWPMMRHRMWGREGTRWDPQQRCIDRLAWRAARRAYVETELNLTDNQRPLWDKLQGIAQGEQRKERQLCQSLKSGEDTTVLDRMDRAQQFLSARLAALQSAKPAVQALYQSLTPEQKEIFDHPFRRD